MALYTVHLPPGEGAATAKAERVRLVRDGFSLFALVAPVIWLLWHRLWLGLLGYILAAVAIEGLARATSPMVATIVAAVFAVWFALSARDIQRWTLSRRGWRTLAVVEGTSREAAERRFFENFLEGETRTPVPPPPPRPAAPPPVRPAPVAAGGSPAIGLFPGPKDR